MIQTENILPHSYLRLQKKSPESINQRIERQIEANVGFFKKQDEQTVRQRIVKLEGAVDIDKAVRMNLVSLALLTGVLSLTVDKRWSTPAAAAAIFLIQQELSGSSIPYKAFRRMGFRTATENDLERKALEQLIPKPE